MRQVGTSNLYTAIWKEKNGWAFKMEIRGGQYRVWEGHGFDTKEAAEAILEERVKSFGSK